MNTNTKTHVNTAENPIFKRPGKLRVSVPLLRNNPEAVLQMASNLLITRAELVFRNNHFEYEAISMMFEEWPDHLEAPFYDAIFIKEKEQDGSDRITFSRFNRRP